MTKQYIQQRIDFLHDCIATYNEILHGVASGVST